MTGKGPRFGEVAIHTPTFAAVAKRAGVAEGHLIHETSVARNTVRSCLGLDGKGPISNVTEAAADKLVLYLGKKLGERLAVTDFGCEFTDDFREIDNFRTSLRRKVLCTNPTFDLFGALARHEGTWGFLESRDNACALYAAFSNNIWERNNPRAHWMCTWRQASAYVAYLRDRGDEESSFYAGGSEGAVRDDLEGFIRALGWWPIGDIRLMVDEKLSEIVKSLNFQVPRKRDVP